MTVALFQSVLKTNEGETVWGSLKQKVVEAAEVPAHVAEGWLEDAKEALADHEIAEIEASNEKLAAQIQSEQLKLDGRTSAAKALKAKNAPNVSSAVESGSTETITDTSTSITTEAAPSESLAPDAPAT